MGSSVVEVRDERRGWLGDLLGRLLEDGGGRSEEGERIGLVEEVGDNLEEVDFDDDDVSVDFVSGAAGSAGGLTLLSDVLDVELEDDILSLIFSASTVSFSNLLAKSPSAEIFTLDRGITGVRLPVDFFTGVSGADLLPAPGMGSMMTSLNVLAISSELLLQETMRALAALSVSGGGAS